jgi:hypothetical protein
VSTHSKIGYEVELGLSLMCQEEEEEEEEIKSIDLYQ